ncbi:MAG: PTS sugar transporter subunit IIB [Erysipelotrichaceae bacterium]|nr:PTS sugar transporter subunit IIB [Erysipelotrichaceae bacterium]MBQ2582513.1 PTS sugar transporter subunit IIB [Erysipelotrichaceae bacterium]
MIRHLRIDNRLIHGQVAAAWMREIGADTVIVCNDEVAADPIQKEVLPTTMKDHTVYVYTIEETLAHAKDHPEEKLFVICKFPADALALLEAGVEVEEINVGNAAPLPGSDYRLVTKSIAVTPEEAKIYRQIADLRGGVLTSRLTTMNETDDFLGLLEKNGL